MTTAVEIGAPRAAEAPPVVWTEMATGVWLARREQNFAGLVERLWGAGYRVTDRHGQVIGEYATLESACRKLD